MSFSRRKVLEALPKRGCVVVREGKRHTVIRSQGGMEIAIPRHNELRRGTVRGIVEDVGLEWEEFKADIS